MTKHVIKRVYQTAALLVCALAVSHAAEALPIVQDSFTESVDTALTSHTPDIGLGWTEIFDDSSAGIEAQIIGSSGTVEGGSDENNVGQAYTVAPSPPSIDQDISFTIIVSDHTDGTKPVGVFGRRVDNDNFYRVQVLPNAHSKDSVKLFKFVGGIATELGTYNATLNSGTVIKLEIRNAAKKVYVDGVERISSIDNELTAVGTWGIYFGGWPAPGTYGHLRQTWSLDDFLAESPGPPTVVTNTNDSGTGSLRAAVDYANANAAEDNITFDIPGAGPHTISLSSGLPRITDDNVTIDATTQSGASCGNLWEGTPPVLKVQINDGSGVSNGLEISGDNVSLKGLSITGFGRGIDLTAAGGGFVLECSFIGLSPAGNIGANATGLAAQGDDQKIGGLSAGEGNVISGNGVGIQIIDSASNVIIQGNFVGTDPTGMSPLKNTVSGLQSRYGTSTINEIRNNLISGNEVGISLLSGDIWTGVGGSSLKIAGNYIGTDRTGNAALGNTGDGIDFTIGTVNDLVIGGTLLADKNLISWNGADGIELANQTGVIIAGNSISQNGGNGVTLLGTGSTAIHSNEIYGNVGLGIDLGNNGVTANDSGDGDTGPNNLLNFPIINEVSVAGLSLNYDINLDAPADANGYRVDFYKSTAADASSYGEGEIHLGFVDIAHAGGDLNFTGIFTPNDTVAEGNIISATTTRKTVASSYDMSSEFSLTYSAIASAAELTASKSVSVYDPSGLGLYILPGNDVIYSLTVTNIGNGNTDADTIVFMEKVPPEIRFYNGDMDDGGPILNPLSFMEGETTGLTFTYGTDVAYSNSGTKPTNFAACNFIPAAGYDNNVTYICVNPKGEMAAGDPDPNFTIAYRARVN